MGSTVIQAKKHKNGSVYIGKQGTIQHAKKMKEV
jgi:hypothetical protein